MTDADELPDWLRDPMPDHVPPEIAARMVGTNENAQAADPGETEAFVDADCDPRDAEHTPDRAEASRFLQALDADPNAVWHFRTFPDAGDGHGSNYAGTLAQCWPRLIRDNAAGRGVFVVVNDGGNKDADITRVRSLYVDLDGAPLEPALAAVRAAAPELDAGIVVGSSPGRWHAYWPTDPADPVPVDQFRDLQKRLIHLTRADPSVKNESRVMRLPGTIHRKRRPFAVRCSKLEPRRFTAAALAQLPPVPLRPVEAPPPAPRAASSSAAPEQARRRLEALLNAAVDVVRSAPEGTRNPTLNARTLTVAGARVDGHRLDPAAIRAAMLAAAAACGLPDAEARATIRSALAAAERLPPHELEDRPRPEPQRERHEPREAEPQTIRQKTDGDRPAAIFRPWSVVSAELGAVKEWIIEGLLAPGWLAIWWGKLGAGKTFVTLDAALSLACGLETWAGRRLRCPGVVAYFAAEDPAGVAERVRAWEIRRGRRVPDTFLMAGAGIRLDIEGAAAVQSELEQMTVRPSVVVVDTLSRAGGFDEQSNTEAAAFVARLDCIRAATGAAFVLVGHPGHEGTRLRGAYAMTAAADVVMEVTRDDSTVTAIADSTEGRKLKNTSRAFTAAFKLESVELGYRDCFGEEVNAGCVRYLPDAPTDASGSTHPPAKQWTLFVQVWTAAGRPTVDGQPALTRTDVLRELEAMGKRKDAAKKAADRMRSDLLKSRTLAVDVAMNWVVVDQKRAAMLVPAPADSEGQKRQTGTIGDIVPSPERGQKGHTPIGVSPCPRAVSGESEKPAPPVVDDGDSDSWIDVP